ncbi:putative outer membrane starch-binding protein [Mangrovibacterium marinum]|uniref:Putative outer membrane starch-binding protein n=2 Tax=Mangrovibacterium marinum TaxID=1639118 RepID=A0A2T5C3Y5_9BACT|nr:putative outer membrane starch-binding protein [Mangrovibacterium marinum]
MAVIGAGLLTACDLDEFNPSTVSADIAYKDPAGFESLINYCYDGLYYFYGKIDGIGIMEMGTDLWISETKESGFTLYNSNMNTELGTLKVFWQGFYSTVNYCNTAIYYADQVEGYTEDEKNAKVAEAYFLRGWSNLQLVEQFGGVVLSTEPSSVAGVDNNPVRSTEADFYDLIISDLKFACEHLPISQGAERGRVSKKAAYGMLAKAYLQRTRLEESNASEYARLALEAAQELIDNQGQYGVALYQSDDNESGYTKLWDGLNNKDNSEFLFLEAVDHESSLNPDWSNRGRTRQYYLMDLKTVGAEWGTTEKYCAWYGRANDRGFKPTKYLLTEIFEPVEDPADTRFDDTFFTDYYNSRWSDYTISQELVDKYGKDASLVGHVIKNTVWTYDTDKSYYGVNASGNVNMVDEDEDGYLDGLSVFTPNYTIPAEEKALMPFLCVDPTDMFDASGRWVTSESSSMGTYYKEVYPSMKKFSSLYWISNNQRWQGDVPILRLGEVYLIAAEAALRYNNDQSLASTYVNAIRERSAIASRASEMDVADSQVTLDFILAERARELAGEQTRWIDLKRFGKLTDSYLAETNPDILTFDESKHIVRPIPQSFLDAIANPGEFGTNGY